MLPLLYLFCHLTFTPDDKLPEGAELAYCSGSEPGPAAQYVSSLQFRYGGVQGFGEEAISNCLLGYSGGVAMAADVAGSSATQLLLRMELWDGSGL